MKPLPKVEKIFFLVALHRLDPIDMLECRIFAPRWLLHELKITQNAQFQQLVSCFGRLSTPCTISITIKVMNGGKRNAARSLSHHKNPLMAQCRRAFFCVLG